jgi:hypothetical protein
MFGTDELREDRGGGALGIGVAEAAGCVREPVGVVGLGVGAAVSVK